MAVLWGSWQRRWASHSSSSRSCWAPRKQHTPPRTARGPRACCWCWQGSITGGHACSCCAVSNLTVASWPLWHRARIALTDSCPPARRPAWRLAAAVAAEPTTNTNARRRLLVFALCAAPPEELLPLLLQWQAADSAAGGGRAASCWDLFSAAESASSASSPHEQQRQQQWLEQQLRGYLSGLGGSAGGLNGEAAALGCLLALGQRGLWQWEQLLAEQQERPLTSQQRHLALLLGLTASALLALQPADVDPLALEAAVASAEARLAAPPAQLLEQVQQRAAPSSEEQQPLSGAASDAGETASGSVTPTPQAVVAASTAKAAAAAVLRFHGLLTSAADAQHLQPLLPGMDVAAALAGGSEGRRALVLQLAAAAGKPPGAAMPPPEAAVVDPNARSTSGQSSQAAASPVRKLGRSMLQRRPSSRKREEAAAAGREHSAAEAARAAPGGSAAWQLSAGAAGDRVQQALQLASKWQVPAWQVHLACVESLLLHSQQQWQAGGTAAQLLGASVPPLLAGQEQAMAMLQALLLRVWPKCSSQWQQHLVEVLQLMQQCSTALAAAEAVAAGSGRGEHWQLAAALFAACQAAEQLVQAAGSIDAKGFLQPVLMLLAAELAADGNEAAAALSTGAQQLATDAAALGQQLMQHVSSSNASQLAGAVGQLKQQHSVAAAAAAAAAAAGAAREDAAPAGACYPCSGSTAYLALFCKSIARQGPRAGKPCASVRGWQSCHGRLAVLNCKRVNVNYSCAASLLQALWTQLPCSSASSACSTCRLRTLQPPPHLLSPACHARCHCLQMRRGSWPLQRCPLSSRNSCWWQL